MTREHEEPGRRATAVAVGPVQPDEASPSRDVLKDVRPEIPLRDKHVIHRVGSVAHWALRRLMSRRGRRVVARRAAFNLSRLVTPIVAVEVADERYFVSTRDRAIGAITFSEGGLDLDLMQLALELIDARTGRSLSGRAFIDVGANIGTATIPALRRFGATGGVAIEPAAQNIELLRCNLLANSVEDDVVIVHAALSDTVGTALLELGESNWGDHRVRAASTAGPSRYGEDERPVERVALTTFDALVDNGTITVSSIGVVWIDTQGHEAQVLAGAESLLDSHVPVVVEYWPYGLRRADGLDRLHQIVANRFATVVDLRASAAQGQPVEIAASELPRLAELYVGTSYTDLLLLS